MVKENCVQPCALHPPLWVLPHCPPCCLSMYCPAPPPLPLRVMPRSPCHSLSIPIPPPSPLLHLRGGMACS